MFECKAELDDLMKSLSNLAILCSWNHRIIDTWRLEKTSWDHLIWPSTHLHRSSVVNPQEWWFHHLYGQPVPMSHHAFGHETSPYIQPEPPLTQLEAITSCRDTATWEKKLILNLTTATLYDNLSGKELLKVRVICSKYMRKRRPIPRPGWPTVGNVL